MLLLLSGCSDRKEPIFADCHRVFVGAQRPPLPPEELMMRSVDLCMETRGYKRDTSKCGTVAALDSACYARDWPRYLLHLLD
jgi:hypothetical protein